MKTTHNRRLFLKGAAGISMGLPLLESVGVPVGVRSAGAADGRFPFAIFMRQGNGIVQDSFWPSQPGALTTADLQGDLDREDRTAGVLAEYADQLNFVKGLSYDFSGSGCGHADGCLQCLTSAAPDGQNSNRTLAMGPSLDWVISQALDPAGTEPVSLYAGATASFLGDVILYRGPMQRRAGEQSPSNAFSRLFGSGIVEVDDSGAAAAIALAERRKSVNDAVRAEMKSLMGRSELSTGDRTRLEAHFDAIRDFEVSQPPPEICAITPQGDFDPDSVDQVVHAHLDVIALSVACGKSHAATLSIGNGNDQTQYTVEGQVMERYHHISHRVRSDGGEGEAIPDAELLHHKIDKKFAGYYKYLLDKLSSIVTPTGTLLDDGVAVWLNDLASGPGHSSSDLPWVLAGGCCGALRTGQFLEGEWGINRIHNTIGAAVGLTNESGAPLDDFGNEAYSKGHIDGLLI